MVPFDEESGEIHEVEDGSLIHPCVPAAAEVTVIHVDMSITIDDSNATVDSWNPRAVFAAALLGMFDAMLAPALLCDARVQTDGDLQFSCDLECYPPSIDRHGSYLLTRKVKDRASNALCQVLKHSLYGNSRSPSRVSSRPQSRALALKTSVLAMTMANLAFGKHLSSLQRGSPFRMGKGHESVQGEHLESSVDPLMAITSQIPLTSSRDTARTSRKGVDYQEIRRRDEIERDITKREGRESLTTRIQRKGNVKLKLRSMADPSISADREEEYEVRNRNKLKSRETYHDSTEPSSNGFVGIAELNPLTKDLQISSTTRSDKTTYRSEDYQGLVSELVVVDRKGDLLVGENCFLVSKKSRRELKHDLSQRSTIKPRVQIPMEPTYEDDTLCGCNTSDPRQSETTTQNPIFEGQNGTFQSYPKIELNSKKTSLTKGVTIKPVESSSLNGLGFGKDVLDRPHTKSSQVSRNKAKPTVFEDQANDALEAQLISLLSPTNKATQETTKLQSCTRRQPVNKGVPEITERERADEHSRDRHSLHRIYHDGMQLHSLRLRTPAYGNTSLWSRSRETFVDDNNTNFSMDVRASLKGSTRSPTAAPSTTSLPGFSSYVREFPSPPKGHINVVLPSTAAALTTSPTKTSIFPFSSLPSVVRGKR